jgi:hypothetical protein
LLPISTTHYIGFFIGAQPLIVIPAPPSFWQHSNGLDRRIQVLTNDQERTTND